MDTDQRYNRRILLSHIKSAFMKGALDASFHSAVMQELRRNENIDAVSKYSWAIEEEYTNKTTAAGYDARSRVKNRKKITRPGSK